MPQQESTGFVKSPQARLHDIRVVHVIGLQPLSGELIDDLAVKIVMPRENVSSEIRVQLADELVACDVLLVIHPGWAFRRLTVQMSRAPQPHDRTARRARRLHLNVMRRLK